MDEFAEWVRQSFGLGDGPLTWQVGGHGAVGDVWRLTVDGRDFAVKRPFGAVDADDVTREALLLDHFAAQGVGVPTHLADGHGHWVADVPDHLGGGHARVSHWVGGNPVGNQGASVAEQLGTLLAQLHRAAPTTEEPPGRWYSAMPSPQEWSALVEASVGQAWHEDLAATHGEHTAYVELVDRAGPPTGPFVVGHRDLHPDNVLVAPDGSLRALDWEDAGPLDPGRELGKVLVQWHVLGDAVDEDAVARTTRAYLAAGGPGALTGPEDFAMVLCTETNFLASQVRLALDHEASPQRRDLARREIAESLGGYLPTLGALDRVLSAAARA